MVSLVLGVLTSPAAAHAQDTSDPLDLSTLAPASSTAPMTPGQATPPEEPLPPGPAPASSTETEPEPETTATGRTVTVAPGDTLWEIAARSLGPQASAPAVDAEWRLWYAANREVIGADPHLLLPGTRLEAPATGTGADR